MTAPFRRRFFVSLSLRSQREIHHGVIRQYRPPDKACHRTLYGQILRPADFHLFKSPNYLREELLIVLDSASSDADRPQVMQKLELMGIKGSTVGLVVPTSYSFNLDGFFPSTVCWLRFSSRRPAIPRSLLHT